MRILTRFIYFTLFLLSLCTVSYAEDFKSRAEIFEKAVEQLKAHPRVIYSSDLPREGTLGYITSNEIGHYSIEFPSGSGNTQLGFGSTINFNVAANRKVKNLILADKSLEVVLANISFWRTMFLAHETPEDFVKNLIGYPASPMKPEIETYFDWVMLGLSAGFTPEETLNSKLEELISEGKISEVDKAVTLTVLNDQYSPPVSFSDLSLLESIGQPVPVEDRGFFLNSRSGLHILFRFARLFGEKQVRTFFEKNNMSVPLDLEERLHKLSFLDQDRYDVIREIYLSESDYYALTDINDLSFWRALENWASDESRKVTDVYLSNIPTYLASQGEAMDHLEALGKITSKDTYVYESASLVSPHNFVVLPVCDWLIQGASNN